MTQSEKIANVKNISGVTDSDSVIIAFLELAGTKILQKCYPFGYDPQLTEVPLKYHYNQVEIASYLLLKRGAEGETAHNENGVSRSYESADVPPSMLKGILPYAKTMFGSTT